MVESANPGDPVLRSTALTGQRRSRTACVIAENATPHSSACPRRASFGQRGQSRQRADLYRGVTADVASHRPPVVRFPSGLVVGLGDVVTEIVGGPECGEHGGECREVDGSATCSYS